MELFIYQSTIYLCQKLIFPYGSSSKLKNQKRLQLEIIIISMGCVINTTEHSYHCQIFLRNMHYRLKNLKISQQHLNTPSNISPWNY